MNLYTNGHDNLNSADFSRVLPTVLARLCYHSEALPSAREKYRPMSNAQRLIQDHLHRYPQMHYSDVYKVLHQGVFGTNLAISKKKNTQEWLQFQWDNNPPSADTPLLEDITLSDQNLVRLHLRSYKAQGGAMKPLLDATLKSGKAMQDSGDAQQLMTAWDDFMTMLAQSNPHPDQFDPREAKLFFHSYARQNYPAAPHSPQFLRAYKPVYRVLRRADADALLSKQQIVVST